MRNKHQETAAAGKKGERLHTEKSARIIQLIKDLIGKRFTGYIKINIRRGSIEKVEKFEEILKNK